ncbi:MAG: hypothetical protein P4L36_01190 [Holophaga sp.]|nr:hypothetical protein [Holophaga sp.]
MAGTRLRAAMSDLAETIRRVFQPPASHPVPVTWTTPFQGAIPPLDAALGQPFSPCEVLPRQGDLLNAGVPVTAPLAFVPVVGGEPGWATWETAAKLCELPLFQPGNGTRLEVPALPRRVATRQEPVRAMAARVRSGWSGFPAPAARRWLQALEPPRSFRGLQVILGLPVAVVGEDLAKVTKALWMRYTLQLVRSTGENIRNLDVIGLYRIPVRGTRDLHLDPSGRLMMTLAPEASGARRALFVLARRKTDASIVFSFVEEV